MYAEITVIVAGAVDETATFTDETDMAEWLSALAYEATGDGYRYDIYVQYHDHPQEVEDCSCAQYETDHRPTYTFNPKGN